MTANAMVMDIQVSDDPNSATYSVQFTATDDPRSGTINVDIDMTLPVDQIRLAIRQAVADYINQVRGGVVIDVSEVKLV